MESTILFSPLKIRELEINNRIMISPMCIYQAKLDGLVSDKHLVHYGQYALGGAGLIMLEATAVEKRGRISAGDLGLWSDGHIAPMKHLVDNLHSYGSKVGIQLAHAGLKGSTRPPWEGNGFLDATDIPKGREPWQTIGPNDGLLAESWPTAKIATKEDLKEIVKAWGDAAARADKAGFDVLEIHGAHGYLISEFLSPLSNFRTNEYGGNEGRLRLACEVVEAVRSNWPEEKPLFFRISVIDGVGVGWSIEDSVSLAKMIKNKGVDVIDCSSGGFDVDRDRAIPRRLGFQTYLADAVKSGANMPVVAVGLITEASQAEKILQENKADIIAIGRTALNNPYWPRQAAKYFGIDEEFGGWPEHYGWWLNRWSRSLKSL